MYYVIREDVAPRSWIDKPYAYYRKGRVGASRLSQGEYTLLQMCDGQHDLAPSDQIKGLLARDLIRECPQGTPLGSWQRPRSCDNLFFHTADWMVTSRCNYRCRHCFVASDSCAPNAQPSLAACKDLLDAFVRCGIQNVNVTGGEPFTRADIRDLFAEICKRDLTIENVTTNATLIDRDDLLALKSLGATPRFKVSFDGVGQHGFLRNDPNAEDDSVNAIRLIVGEGFEVLAQMALHRENAGSLLETARLLASLGVTTFRVMRIMETPRWADECIDMTLGITEYFDVCVDFLQAYARAGIPMKLILWSFCDYDPKTGIANYHDVIDHPERLSPETLLSLPLCSNARGTVAIAYDGELSPCNQVSGYLRSVGVRFGNAFDTDLQDLLREGPYVEAVTQCLGRLRQEGRDCADCEFWTDCLGGCRATAAGFSNADPYASSPMACAFYKLGYPERIDRVLQTMDGATK